MNKVDNKNPKSNSQGITRLGRALRCSVKGLWSACKSEPSFRLELLLCLLLVPLSFRFGRTGTEQALLLGSLLLVLIVELLNSALKTMVDRISTEQHPLSGRAKDFGSAAVFIALANLAVVWLCIIL